MRSIVIFPKIYRGMRVRWVTLLPEGDGDGR